MWTCSCADHAVHVQRQAYPVLWPWGVLTDGGVRCCVVRGEAYPVLCPWGVLTDGGVRCCVVRGEACPVLWLWGVLTDGGVRCRVVRGEACPVLWLWGVTYRGRRQKPCRHLHDPQTRHSALGRPGLSGHDLFFLWTFCTEMCLMQRQLVFSVRLWLEVLRAARLSQY